MSVKKDIFKIIGMFLMAELRDLPDGLPDLQWFDKQMGQFDNPEQSYAIPLPCVLMSYNPLTWTSTGLGNQTGDGTITFTVYFENYADSFSGSFNQELALKFFDFTEAVHKALQGLSIKNMMSALDRIGDTEDIAQDMIITSSEEYIVQILDNSTDIKKNFVDVDPVLNVEYKNVSSRPVIIVDNPAFLT